MTPPERTAWTDERLDEKMDATDQRLDRIEQQLDLLRDEMRLGFAELRAEISALQHRMIQIGFGLLGVAGTSMIALILALSR